jgi:3-phosphoshikimate 1-carboxyvinyltransferase
MNIHVKGVAKRLFEEHIQISGSKSESNRLLILQQLFSEVSIENLSDSDDTRNLTKALTSSDLEVNIGHAGTAMRFLTAFFATQNDKTVVLSGSHRMHNRPIKILVDALKDLGADITYIEKEGYPPLKIVGKELTKDGVAIQGNVSSQYISALLLIAPSLPNGLEVELIGEITSVPYIQMTLSLLDQIGVDAQFKGQKISVKPLSNSTPKEITVESDWSSASYFYSIVALGDVGSEVRLSAYKSQSLQGDKVLAEIYQHFGVQTVFEKHTILLKKQSETKTTVVALDLNKAPDIAQTIAVTCFGLGIGCKLTGLHTLKIKETDRLEALKEELTKLGASITVTTDSLHLKPASDIRKNVAIETYHDHRMAMAFAPLGIVVPITILDANVVTKSYRSFWKDLQQIGFQTQEL